ncbi:glycosyltransferase involved in cell wall bisynthesis [Hoeflea halophila]|uniref:Glycosyltransferase involved in cell wall bisynthesis n=1 Tax=Hoeflea halophila TaxID=714899 RepID=A0A286IB85_9HYPH|nr:glycosyltransferase family 4 protein [Hoeflea halophila]SOE17331.1 glycosyltransferase involved in cell wall bisynthesis [Hoeflea halophila]
MAADRPLRILHCFRSPVGGIFRHVRDLVEEHAKAGHQVGILCDSTTGGAYEDALFESIMPHLALGLTRLPIRRSLGLSDITTAKKSFGEIKNLQPDVLHGHGAKGGAFVRLIGSRLRVSRSCVARFYSPHGGSLHYDAGTIRGQAYFAIERFLERWTEALVFVSDYERRTYEAKIGTPRTAWRLIHNGLRAHEFDPVGTAQDAVDFLYIGMMRDLKGPDVFIEAMRKAEQLAGRPLRGTMVGDGDDKPRYQARLDAIGMGERVRMRDAMPARDAFALARTVVIPSRAESMPYIVLEAVAAGKPVISTRVGGIPEILGPSFAGFVPPGDSEALAGAMAHAISDPQWLPGAMPEMEMFRQNFSAQTMADRMASLYQEHVAGERRTRR